MSKVWLACCFLLPPFLRAEEATMAWHFAKAPVTQFGDMGVSPKILENPPVTAFVAKGDRLIDLSDVLRRRVKGGDETWLIWNETRHELVARGKATTLALVEQGLEFYDQPMKLVTTFDWYEGIEPGKPVPAGTTPVGSFTTTSQSGAETSSEWSSAGQGPLSHVKVEGEVTSAGFDANFRWIIGWSEPGAAGKRLGWSFNSCGSSDAGTASPVALVQCVSPPGKNWTITARVESRLSDGTPMGKMLQTEVDGKPRLIQRHLGFPTMLRHGKIQRGNSSFWCASFTNAEEALEFLAEGPESDRNKAPFFEGLVDATVPEELKALAGGPLIDCGKLVSRAGLIWGPFDFAGYDPQLRRLLVAVEDETTLEMIEQLTCRFCSREPSTLLTHLKVDMGDPAKASFPNAVLICKSGQKGELKCLDPDGGIFTAMAVEPTLGENGHIVDLQYEMICGPPSGFETRMEGGATLIDGREVVIQSGKAGGRSMSFTGRVDILKETRDR